MISLKSNATLINSCRQENMTNSAMTDFRGFEKKIPQNLQKFIHAKINLAKINLLKVH